MWDGHRKIIGRDQSPLIIVFGLIVAIVAVVGMQVFGWEWGSDQLIPTIIGIGVACIAVVLVVRDRLESGD